MHQYLAEPEHESVSQGLSNNDQIVIRVNCQRGFCNTLSGQKQQAGIGHTCAGEGGIVWGP